jgi:ERCC4-type nuclease
VIYVDDRVGSRELTVPLLRAGYPTELQRLAFADVAFAGRGPDGDCLIGVERKTVPDLVASILSGRLTIHQLPGLAESYAYAWLLVEGPLDERADGTLRYGGREARASGAQCVKASAIRHFLHTVELQTSIRVLRTASTLDTVQAIGHLYTWWRRKAWDEHAGHLPIATVKHLLNPWGDKQSLTARMAQQIRGLGYKRADVVASTFGSPLAMTTADEDDWRRIDGIGPTLARRIVAALATGEEKN